MEEADEAEADEVEEEEGGGGAGVDATVAMAPYALDVIDGAADDEYGDDDDDGGGAEGLVASPLAERYRLARARHHSEAPQGEMGVEAPARVAEGMGGGNGGNGGAGGIAPAGPPPPTSSGAALPSSSGGGDGAPSARVLEARARAARILAGLDG